MTHFEGYSHEQLWAMISSTNPETVKARAAAMVAAATTIRQVGDRLKKTKVSGWEGEGALKFADWVSRAGSATLRLADYSETGGKEMIHVAQVMIEAKVNAKYDAAKAATLQANLEASREFHNDPDAQKIGQQSYSTLNGDHQRAIDALAKLAQRYDESAKQMKATEPPTFPPPPGEFVPQVEQYGMERTQRSGGAGAADTGGYSYVAPAPSGGGGANESGSVPGHRSQPDITLPPTTGPAPVVVPVPDRDVDVDLDHVATLPEKTLPPTTAIPGPGPSGPNPVGTLPPLTVPPIGLPGPRGGGGGLPPGITGPGGKVGLPPGITSPPGGKVGGRIGLPPRDTGIVGGQQVPTNGPSRGIPRGTVIGEGMQGGRGMMGGGGVGGGMGGPHGPSGGSMAGRRLAVEPGGVVGGRQLGAVGRPVTGGQPFTQGGSGLVRNGSGASPVGGAMGHAGAGASTPGRRRDDQGGNRPDYLTEDEETWQANRRVVPPVID
ncbi:hypothetical protein MTF65_06910 [Streptomyces sp. APSN-46.1]|uniref:hypothetical protein n=1 Tax=Streptomyces sp. APSN-46.1 TaxID=2929049 RepID=UPI001FB40313|nr:hypothetical protein [Streptomyces sp. APSN-46.1]MCJ1677079.1 hypothetical protein [Streptomyces sp. APSN-46.1]